MSDQTLNERGRGPNGELLYRIPRDTKPEACKRPGCRMTVYWVKTKNNKSMIVDTSIEGTCDPIRPGYTTPGTDGVGAAHWGQCRDKAYVRAHGKTRGKS